MRIAITVGVALVAAVLTGALAFGGDRAIDGTAVAAQLTPTSQPSPPPRASQNQGAADVMVGDCLVYDQPNDPNTLAHKVDCAAPYATYQVGYRRTGVTGTCPTESYDQYTQTGPAGDFMLCLMMNGDQGDCFTGYSGPDDWKAKAPCGTAEVVVSLRLDDRADATACPARSGWQLVYPEVHRTICLNKL